MNLEGQNGRPLILPRDVQFAVDFARFVFDIEEATGKQPQEARRNAAELVIRGRRCFRAGERYVNGVPGWDARLERERLEFERVAINCGLAVEWPGLYPRMILSRLRTGRDGREVRLPYGTI